MSRESHCNVEAQCIEFGLHKSFSSLHMFSGNPIPPSFIISLNLRTTRKETKMKPSCLFKQIILTLCQAKPLRKKKKNCFLFFISHHINNPNSLLRAEGCEDFKETNLFRKDWFMLSRQHVSLLTFGFYLVQTLTGILLIMFDKIMTF